jgi:integrase
MAAQMQDQPHPVINPQSLNEVSAYSGINPNSIGVNHLPKPQSRVTEKVEQAPELPEPETPKPPVTLPNTRINPSADTALISNPWLEIAKHSGLSVPPTADPIPPSDHPAGDLL